VNQSRRRMLMSLILLAAGTLVFGIPCFGDAYRVHSVYFFEDQPNPYSFYGIDNVGNFVINVTNGYIDSPYPCAGIVDPSACYQTYYVRTNQTILSVNPPSLHYDDGVPCTPGTGDPNFVVLAGVCNNGHEIFGGAYFVGGIPQFGIWTGPDPGADFLEYGLFSGGFINHLGDAVFTLQGRGGLITSDLEWAEDLTTSTPEPSSLFLVGSGGLLLVAGLLRSTWRRAKSSLDAEPM
jgi:hypothetical protein